MIWFILAVILLLIGVGMIAVALANGGDGAGFGFIPIIVAALLMIPACLYSLDVGEVAVIRNMGGSVAGHAENAGFHAKAPWQSVIKYDTRNNLINFFKDTDYKYDGGSAEGKEITVNDRSGASANIDIQVNYSLEPSAAEMLYSEYGKQTTFTQNYIGNDLRSVARETSGKFDTITMLTDRGKYTKAVQDALTSKWKSIGLTVEQVSVQDIRYPKSITDSYAQAEGEERAGDREGRGRDEAHQGAGRGRREQGAERFPDRQRAPAALHRRFEERRPADRHTRGLQHPHPTQMILPGGVLYSFTSSSGGSQAHGAAPTKPSNGHGLLQGAPGSTPGLALRKI
jgi:regulator of protease activity HflC (stomatin/prohibitin superfamily)